MSTIATAAQLMVDKLILDMQGTTPLNPEEQLLVAKALDTMKNNASFEQALIVVAEQHLNDSTAAMNSAENAVLSAKTSLDSHVDNLSLIPAIKQDVETEINKIISTTAAITKVRVVAAALAVAGAVAVVVRQGLMDSRA